MVPHVFVFFSQFGNMRFDVYICRAISFGTSSIYRLKELKKTSKIAFMLTMAVSLASHV